MKNQGVRKLKKKLKFFFWGFGFEEGSRLRKKMNFNCWFLIYPSFKDSKRRWNLIGYL